MNNTNMGSWPLFTQEEADAVSNVLLSNKVNYWVGDEGRNFESEFAKWCNVKHAIALANGTAALNLALKALGVREGDEVIVTPRSFIASASCVVNVGAAPVFADVDLNSGNITVESIEAVISNKTKAIICVHLMGYPCNMDEIMALADRKNLYVIEDCAQAHGAKYKGKPVGSIGHIGCWSFCQDKIMTTGGEGGMVTTNSENLWKEMWAYKDHGKSYDWVYKKKHPSGFRWLHKSFGTNWRMTEMQAAIGRIQLNRMTEWHQRRKKNAQTILNTCSQFSKYLRVPKVDDDVEHAWYKCCVYLKKEVLNNDLTNIVIVDRFRSLGVSCFIGPCPEIYLENAFSTSTYGPSTNLPNAKELGDVTLMFLVHPSLSSEDIDTICKTINIVMKSIDEK